MNARLLVTVLALAAVSMEARALSLPFEVGETLLDLVNSKELAKINPADNQTVRPIYRKDLDPTYIAYYEFNLGKKYMVLSAGPKSGDNREVQSGPNPSPTEMLIKQAKKAGQQCAKFYRLTSTGLHMCENRKEMPVAATFDWISDFSVVDVKKLPKMVRDYLDEFKSEWNKHAQSPSVLEEWKTAKRLKTEPKLATQNFEADVVSPGSTVKVALEANYTKISIHAIPERRQGQLCKILVEVCKKNGMAINPARIHKRENGISYIQFDVNDDKKLVRKVLHRKEISFYVNIVTKDGEQLLKYFSVDLKSHRNRRWSPWSRWEIEKEYLFPDYNQHECCGCYSGCGPVAWAQILGYYDRLANSRPSSGYSNRFWTCRDAGQSSSSGSCVAPRYMDTNVKRYIEGIRSVLGTSCTIFGIFPSTGGLTWPWEMPKIVSWYKSRGIGSRIRSHWDYLAQTGDSYLNSAVSSIKARYPTIVGIWMPKDGKKKKAGHYAVVTKYREKHRRVRHCWTGWWWRRKCRTKTEYDRRFFLRMGWGGSSNGWLNVEAYATYHAKQN